MPRNLTPLALLGVLAQVFLVPGLHLSSDLFEHHILGHGSEHHSLQALPLHVIHSGLHVARLTPPHHPSRNVCSSMVCTYQYIRYKRSYDQCSGCDSVCSQEVVKYCRVRCWRHHGARLCRYCRTSGHHGKTWRRTYRGTEIRGSSINRYRHRRRHYRRVYWHGGRYHRYRGTQYTHTGTLTRYTDGGQPQRTFYRKQHHQRHGVYGNRRTGVYGFYHVSATSTRRHSVRRVCYRRRCRSQFLKRGRCHGRCHGCTSYWSHYSHRYCRRCHGGWGLRSRRCRLCPRRHGWHEFHRMGFSRHAQSFSLQ